MLGFVSRKILFRLPNRRVLLEELLDCPCFGFSFIRSFSLEIKKGEQPFAVSYLINSFGFSQEAAVSAALKAKLKFESPDVPTAVLALLRDQGFSESQISKVVRSRPHVLRFDPKAVLLPKIRFFCSVGLSRTQVSELFSSKPLLFTYNLKGMIIPWYIFLKKLLSLDKKVIAALKHPSMGLFGKVEQHFAPNIAFLREVGTPESRISRLVILQPRVLTLKTEDFKELVAKITEMGFSPLCYNFLHAFVAFSGYKVSTLEHKKDIYRRCGWSENEIEMAFKMCPISLFLSEKKITSGMEFLVKKMGWPLRDIIRSPRVLFFSLEKRIIPRCSVIQVLQLKCLVKKDLSLISLLGIAEKEFLNKFVTKFQDDVPELLSVYQGKVAGLDLIGKI